MLYYLCSFPLHNCLFFSQDWFNTFKIRATCDTLSRRTLHCSNIFEELPKNGLTFHIKAPVYHSWYIDCNFKDAKSSLVALIIFAICLGKKIMTVLVIAQAFPTYLYLNQQQTQIETETYLARLMRNFATWNYGSVKLNSTVSSLLI